MRTDGITMAAFDRQKNKLLKFLQFDKIISLVDKFFRGEADSFFIQDEWRDQDWYKNTKDFVEEHHETAKFMEPANIALQLDYAVDNNDALAALQAGLDSTTNACVFLEAIVNPSNSE